ncbi:hypothetical protein C8A00DRAFT_42572 [Chaetomidium leptoderma]|uniref:Fork-head domain-containing protein n=1 Tax=Chaetomidium leptoderma TaxID=669021 RepID=A0AAN6VQT4_9PEZI|nr:hypothetical protein C8A00DRAFT_42572 [Chaetomidium leptoderma]
MATLSTMGAVYASPPQEVTRTSASPDPTDAEQQLVAGMSALQSHDNDSQRAYMPSHWSGCLEAPMGNDEFENYAIHRSPTLSSLQQSNSAQSSPRSWESPEQLGPTPWEAATEQLHSRYPGLDPQLSGYLHNGNIPTSFPVDSLPFVPTQSFSGSENEYQRARSQTEPYPAGYQTSSGDGYASTPESGPVLSPCSTTLTLAMEDGDPNSPTDDVNSQASTMVVLGSDHRYRGKKSPTAPEKGEEPYAKLIYRAFLSSPERAMTLQEIYQWFRENTEKGKDDTKGWQNSIRHNLSMNLAFTKRERRSSTTKDRESGSGISTSNPTDSKKSTEWYLEPWAISGVESTTRYRKGNQARRSATSHGGLTSHGYRGYAAARHHHHHHNSFGSRKSNAGGGGRMHRGGGTQQSLRSSTTAAATSHAQQIQQQQQQFHFSPHHPTASSSPFIHHLINDPASSSSPYSAPPSFFHHPPTTTTTTTTMDPAGLIEYDYPEAQLFPAPPASSSTSSSMEAARGAASSSEQSSAATMTDNEPVTPEPLAPLLPVPPYHHHPHGGGGDGRYGQGQGYGFVPVTVPGVYEEDVVMMGRYQQHTHHHQLHHHHDHHQGWEVVTGMEGVVVCGEEGPGGVSSWAGSEQGY